MPRVNRIFSWLPLEATQVETANCPRASTTGDSNEFTCEHLPITRFEISLPIEASPDVALDLLLHVRRRPTDEPFHDVWLGERPSESGDDLRLGANCQAFTVDQHSVTGEDDEVERAHAGEPIEPAWRARTVGPAERRTDGMLDTQPGPA